MPAYGPGGVANSFLQGAIGGASLVHNIAREDRLDAENTRRYNTELERANRAEQRLVQAENAKKTLARFQYMMDDVQGDPDKLMEKYGSAVAELVNTDPTFATEREFLQRGARVDRDKPMAGLVAFDDKSGNRTYSLTLNATDPQTGKRYQAPLSQNRGTDDPVPTFSAKQLVGAVEAKLAEYGYQSTRPSVDALQALQPRALRSAATAAPRPPTAPAQAPTAPAQAPTASAQAPTASAQAPTAAAPELPKDLDPIVAKSDARDIGRIQRLQEDLKTAPPVRQAAITREIEDLAASRAARLRKYGLTEEQMAATRAEPAGGFGSMFGKSTAGDDPFDDATPGDLSESVTEDDVASSMGAAASRLSPGVVARPEQQAKLEAALPANPAPAMAKAAVTSVSRPAAGRSGLPSRAQLASALLLKKRGLISAEQLTRYAQTGKIDKSEIKFRNPEYDIVDENGNVISRGTPNPAHSAAAADKTVKRRTDAIKHYESSMKDLIDAFNPPKGPKRYTSADFGRRMAESVTELQKQGVPVDPEVLAYSPALKGILASVYKEAVDKSKPEGWFREAIKKPIGAAMAEAYPDLAKPRPIERAVTINGQQRTVVHDPATNKYYYKD